MARAFFFNLGDILIMTECTTIRIQKSYFPGRSEHCDSSTEIQAEQPIGMAYLAIRIYLSTYDLSQSISAV